MLFKLPIFICSVSPIIISSFTTTVPFITSSRKKLSNNKQCNLNLSFSNNKRRYLQYSTSTFMSSFSSEDMPSNNNYEYNDNDDNDDNELREHKSRRTKREKRESVLKERYVMGNELIELREEIAHTEKLIKQCSKSKASPEDMDVLKKQVRGLRSRDAEFVYGVAMKEMRDTQDEKDVMKWKQIALDARSCIAHFNLEGLWVGKYGSHGYEMINITYVGDNLIAYKVTGDKNVPKGEITFQADLAPSQHESIMSKNDDNNNSARKLDPIQLTETAAKHWGVKQLQRYPGLGHVADADNTKNQWLDGQFIMIGENYFSFAWVPIGYQIFFGRPSEEVILNMMRKKVYKTGSSVSTEIQQESSDNQLDQQSDHSGNNIVLSELDADSMRDIASRSMEETIAIMEEEEVSGNQLDYDNMDGCFE